MPSRNDTDSRLDELQDMVDENRILLKKIEKRLALAQTMKIVYWVVIISLSVFGYYAIQPYIDDVQATFEGIQGGIDTVGDFFNK